MLNRFGVDISWVMITFTDQEKEDRGTDSRLIVARSYEDGQQRWEADENGSGWYFMGVREVGSGGINGRCHAVSCSIASWTWRVQR